MRYFVTTLFVFALHSFLGAQTSDATDAASGGDAKQAVSPSDGATKEAGSVPMPEKQNTEAQPAVDKEKVPGEPDQSTMTEPYMTDKAEETQSEQSKWDPQTFHTSTPESLKEKLRLGLGLELGSGSGNDGKFQQDTVGSTFFAAYDLSEYFQLGLLPEAKDMGLFTYKNYTGIEVESKKFSENAVNIGVQAFVFSYGLEIPLPEYQINVLAHAGLGVTKESRLTEGGMSMQASKMGGVIELGGHAFYNVLEKMDVFAGLSMQAGTFSRLGLEFGMNGTF